MQFQNFGYSAIRRCIAGMISEHSVRRSNHIRRDKHGLHNKLIQADGNDDVYLHNNPIQAHANVDLDVHLGVEKLVITYVDVYSDIEKDVITCKIGHACKLGARRGLGCAPGHWNH